MYAMAVRRTALAPEFPALTAHPRDPDVRRRIVNVVVAIAGIVLTAPLIPLLAWLVAATSQGPVLYGQPRIGLNRRRRNTPVLRCRRRYDLGGTPFTIYKFRTMRVRAEHLEGARWAAPGDDRVTPVGRVLRKYRLDEIPQLYNALSGQMNVVGPRPEQPAIFAALRSVITGYGERQSVRPGITGLAQVTVNYDTTLDGVERKVALDLHYIRHRSVWQDLKIIARTFGVVFRARGGW